MELMDQSIKLRPFNKQDTHQLIQFLNNKKIWDNVRDLLPFPYTEQHAIDFITSAENQNPTLTFAIEFKGSLIGCISLVKQTDVYKLSAEIGYWIGEPYWGKGLATQAVKLITHYGLENLQLIRIHTGVFSFNKSSQRVLEKAGYKLEGIFEKSVIKNDIVCDEYRYAITANINQKQLVSTYQLSPQLNQNL